MAIIAKEPAGRDFIPAPSGTHIAVCCDVVDLGVLEVSFGGESKQQHKVNLVWQIEEVMSDNRPYMVRKRYTLSLHEKAALRKDLESWRGRTFTPEELQGFDLEVLIGKGCILSVIHNPGNKGGVFANIAAIMKLPKGAPTLTVRDYVRVCDREPEPQSKAPEQDWGPINDDDVPF